MGAPRTIVDGGGRNESSASTESQVRFKMRTSCSEQNESAVPQ